MSGHQRPVDRPGARHRALRLVAALGLVLLTQAWPAPAHAHTDLVASSPAAGDTVGMATDRLVLVFGEPLAQGTGQVLVLADDAVDAVAGAAVVAGDTVEVGLELRRPGRHEVTYRVVSDDGHAIVGDFDFTVTDEAGSAAATTAPQDASGVAPGAGQPPATSTGARATWLAGTAVVLVGATLIRLRARSPRPVRGRPVPPGPR